MLDRAIIRFAWIVVSLTSLASLLVSCGEPEQESPLSEAAALGPRPMATKNLSDSLYDAAVMAEMSGDYTAAATFLSSLHNRNPKDLRTAIALARNLRYGGSTEPAIDILKDALARNPNEPVLVAELGKVQLAAGQPKQALASLIRAREQAPDDWRVHSALGIAYDRLGKYRSARLSYESALDLAPGNVTVLNNLALSYAQVGELDRGIDVLVRAAASPTATMQVRQNLALLHALNGDIDEAEKLARQDLPEDMVRKNLEYYRTLAASRSTAGAGGGSRPGLARAGLAKGTVALQIIPWEEDTEVERTSALSAGAKQ